MQAIAINGGTTTVMLLEKDIHQKEKPKKKVKRNIKQLVEWINLGCIALYIRVSQSVFVFRFKIYFFSNFEFFIYFQVKDRTKQICEQSLCNGKSS